MKGIFGRISLALLSIIVVGGTLYLDARAMEAVEPMPDSVRIIEGTEKAKIRKNGDQEFFVTTGSGDRFTAVVLENALIRLAPETSLKFSWDGKISIVLERGRVWVNTLASAVPMELAVKNSNVRADPGIFDFQLGNGVLLAAALRHDFSIQRGEKKIFVPEGNQVSFSESKSDQKIEPVFLGRNDAWVSGNLADDEKLIASYRRNVLEEIRQGGPKIGSGESLSGAFVALTFDPVKKTERQTQAIMDYFDDGVFAAAKGDEALAAARFRKFEEALNLAPADIRASAVFQQEFSRRKSRFAFAVPSSDFFAAKAALRNTEFFLGTGAGRAMQSLSLALNDILDAAASGEGEESRQRAISLLSKFSLHLSEAAVDFSSPELRDHASRISVSLKNLFRRKPGFIREEFLSAWTVFDAKIAEGMATPAETVRMRRQLLAEKVEFMDRMYSALRRGEMAYPVARGSILLLANQLESSSPAELKALPEKTAELRSYIQPFVAFLRTPSAGNLHGSFQPEFESFRKEQDELRKIVDLLSTSTGGEFISTTRREELVASVTRAFGEAGIDHPTLTLPDDEDDVRVTVDSAELEGKIFNATYDTARKIFSDVRIGKEKIPNAVRLENMKKIFLLKAGKLVLQKGESLESFTEVPADGTLLERVVRAKLFEVLKKMEISVEEKNVDVSDISKGFLSVRLAFLGEGAEAIVFSFDVSTQLNLVKNLKVQTATGEIPVNEEFGLRDLASRVATVYQRAAFEKEKEEELKKLLEEKKLGEKLSEPEAATEGDAGTSTERMAAPEDTTENFEMPEMMPDENFEFSPEIP